MLSTFRLEKDVKVKKKNVHTYISIYILQTCGEDGNMS